MSDRMTLVIAIGLSLFLWVYVRLAHQEPEVTRTVRMVQVRKTGESTVPTHAYEFKEGTDRIDLVIKGSVGRVNSLSRDDIIATIDVAKIPVADDQKAIAVTPQVDLPPGVRLEKPPTIDMVTYPLIQRTLPVRIGFLSLPKPGSTIGEYIVEPEEVIVVGKATDVEKIDYATVILDPTQPLTTAQEYVPRAVGKSGRIVEPVKMLTSTVRVRMASLTGLQATRQIAVKPPVLKNISSNYHVFVERVEPDKVVLSGPSVLLERLPAFIDTEDLDVANVRGDSRRTVELKIPQGLTVANGSTIQVFLKALPK